MRERVSSSHGGLTELRPEAGLRSIGVSNFSSAQLEQIVDATGVTPAVDQIELHPYFQQAELRREHAERGIATEAWGPLCQGGRHTAKVLADPVLADIGQAHGKSVGQVVIRWHLQIGTPNPAPPGPVWTAAAVARRLGVAPGTLRSWSRCYGIGPAPHTPGRHRRYTAADRAEIQAMRELVAQGMVLPAAAAIVRSRRLRLTGDGRGSAHVPPAAAEPVPAEGSVTRGDPVAELLADAGRLDLDTACTLVAAGLAGQGVITTWDLLCRPAFADLETVAADDPGCTDTLNCC